VVDIIGRHPESFGFRRRHRPVGQGILPQALFAHEHENPFHRSRGVEAQDQGLEEGQFLGAASNGPGQIVGNARRLFPGTIPILLARSTQPVEGRLERFRRGGRFAQCPRNEHLSWAQPQGGRQQQTRLGAESQEVFQVAQEGISAGLSVVDKTTLMKDTLINHFLPSTD